MLYSIAIFSILGAINYYVFEKAVKKQIISEEFLRKENFSFLYLLPVTGISVFICYFCNVPYEGISLLINLPLMFALIDSYSKIALK